MSVGLHEPWIDSQRSKCAGVPVACSLRWILRVAVRSRGSANPEWTSLPQTVIIIVIIAILTVVAMNGASFLVA